MYTIKKEFGFSASHQLLGLKENHPCSRIHGHNYTVIVTLQSRSLNKHGFVMDYRDLEPIKQFINDKLDHQHLNYVFNHQPSAEKMAESLYHIFSDEFDLGGKLKSVAVKETDKTIAIYSPEPVEED